MTSAAKMDAQIRADVAWLASLRASAAKPVLVPGTESSRRHPRRAPSAVLERAAMPLTDLDPSVLFPK